MISNANVVFYNNFATELISENNHWTNQSFYEHCFISVNIFTNFTSERAKTSDFSVKTYTTDGFSENLTDSVLFRVYNIEPHSKELGSLHPVSYSKKSKVL